MTKEQAILDALSCLDADINKTETIATLQNLDISGNSCNSSCTDCIFSSAKTGICDNLQSDEIFKEVIDEVLAKSSKQTIMKEI